MNRILCSAILCSLIGSAAQAQAPMPVISASVNAILFGAYRPVPADSPEVREARDFVQSRMVSMSLGEVNVAYEQVVAGTNFKFVCSVLEDGQQTSWKFVVYRDLERKFHFSLAQHL